MSSMEFGSDEDDNAKSNRKKKRDGSLRRSLKQGNGRNHTPLPHLLSEVSIDDEEGSVFSEGSAQMGRKKRGRKKTQQEHPELFAARETQQIWWLKGVTLVSFLIVTCMVSTVIFYNTKRFEQDQFEKTFEEQAKTIGETFRSNLQRGVGALDNLAASITSTTESSSSSWPFVIVPDFAQRAAGTRELVKADLLSLVPLVPTAQREGAGGWEAFSVSVARGWIDDGLQLEDSNVDYVDYHSRQRKERTRKLQTSTLTPVVYSTFGVATSIFRWEGQDAVVDTENRFENYFPMWQNSPVQKDLVNFNLLSHDTFGTETQLALEKSQIILGSFVVSNESAELPTSIATTEAFEPVRRQGEEPMSQILFPVVESLAPGQVKPTIVAMLQAIVFWGDYLKGEVLPPSANGIICVINNGCGQTYAYQVVGDSANFTYLGEGAQSEKIFQHRGEVFEIGSVFDKGQVTYSGLTVNEDYCPYSLHVYPTETVKDSYFSRRPVVYTSLFGIVFIFTSAVFLCYDFLVERRQRRVMDTAVKSHEIVANLFPENIRGRLFGKEGKGHSDDGDAMGRQNAAAMMGEARGSKVRREGGPIADLFPATSVLFADIAGFTAWSSVRDPAQVFILLETIYAAFDKIATRRRVFKVETIGDCYVAVTGLPNPQPDHAVIMIKFARDCLRRMRILTTELEVELGPDTGDLCLRIGIHSGPVTAGVLRGQKSRFQLFGDTVNTASRMESNGRPNHIQVSQQTADILKEGNKLHWLVPRSEMVHAKGKGLVQTYWVADKAMSQPGDGGSASHFSETASDHSDNEADDEEAKEDAAAVALAPPRRAWSDLPPHMQRLIHWNVDMLGKLLKNVVAWRRAAQPPPTPDRRQSRIMNFSINLGIVARPSASSAFSSGTEGSNVASAMLTLNNPRDEYAEAISLPRFDPTILLHDIDPNNIQLDEVVAKQLEDYVTTIACAYHENPFHNFEHASHVTMSCNKILKRVVAGDELTVRKTSLDKFASRLHNFTYGITSDPLTHFACVFSAMIHDVDHPGVPNAELVKENDEMAEMYDNKSVAEQNSFDFSWELLMDPSYEELRKCIFSNDEELKRFRQLVVNSILATDVFDSELVKLRNARWEKAFLDESEDGMEEPPVDKTDLKATIVIEHIIQAADVAHTMQHWHVYQKWNRRLFEEMYSAYKSGRGKDPSLGWYKGELWFFDNYIIPLAKKLKDCGVFGPSSDEFLTYAMDNRSEWQAKGESIVEDMVNSCTIKSEELSLLG